MSEAAYPDATMRYGTSDRQVADVFEPAEPTDSLVLVLPGGLWRPTDRTRSWAAGRALADAGHLTAAVEYRRGPGQWAAALDDVAAAIEQIQLSGREWTVHNQAPRRITVVGHSSGGQLALWAASRGSLAHTSRWHASEPLVTGVVVMAPAADLTAMARRGYGAGAVTEFLGGGPDQVPDAYAAADPARLRPTVPLRLLHGSADDVIPAALTQAYVEGLAPPAPEHTLELVDGAGHEGWGDPHGPVWERVRAAVAELVL
jgi:acetyl esterase/lipase